MTGKRKEALETPAVGLCARCRRAQVVRSSRGSVFYRCGLAATDRRFPKYPALPVLKCSGFEEPGDPL